MVLNVHTNHKAYLRRAKWGMEVMMMMFGFMSSDVRYEGGRKEKLYNYRYTVTARMTPALRWAATRAILMFY